MPKQGHKFDLKQQVAIAISRETGEVIGRADYVTHENTYLVRYKTTDGRAVESWWDESALVAS